MLEVEFCIEVLDKEIKRCEEHLRKGLQDRISNRFLRKKIKHLQIAIKYLGK